MYVMGIDGGGSTVRVLITDSSRIVYSQVQDTGVNPSALGQHQTTPQVQAAMRRALAESVLFVTL